jgi:hypothetical protein
MAMTAEQVIELKAKLKAELARRSGLGSVAEFASDEYDFTEVPQAGRAITADQGKKIIDLLLQICDYKDLRYVVKGDTLPEAFDAELLDLVDKLSKEQITGDSTEVSSCNGLCTGLCVGSCINTCNGCTGCTGSSGAKIYGHGVSKTSGTINRVK